MTFESPYCTFPGCGRFWVNRVTKVCGTHEREAKQTQNAIDRKNKGTGSGLRKSSPKRAADTLKYNARVKVWLVGKNCAVFPHLKATQCHHKKGRNGALLLDERYWLPVSTAGHNEINSRPEWAREKGFIILRSAA